MSRRVALVSNRNFRSENSPKRLKICDSQFSSNSFRNVFEEFDEILPATRLEKSKDSPVSKISSQFSCSNGRSIVKATKKIDDDQLWSDLFAPKTRQNLLVHPKKVKELEEILKNSCEIAQNQQKFSKLILVSGPSGSGKSTCLRVLADSLKIRVVEWETRTTAALTKTALDQEQSFFEFFLEFSIDENFLRQILVQQYQWVESQKRLFRTFLFQSTRYTTSTTAEQQITESFLFDFDEEEKTPKLTNKQLVLVEDIPNGFYSDVSSFHSMLRELKRFARNPIVFVLTENSCLSSLNNPQILFPLSIVDELKIEQIHFNPIAPSFMKKALDSIVFSASIFKNSTKQKDFLNEIIQYANGDLRLAINNLQFSHRKTENSERNDVFSRKDQRETKSTDVAVAAASKDISLSLFQGLGRILHKKDLHEAKFQSENLIDQCHISPRTFIGFLFENYPDFYSSIEDVGDLCENLSFAENLSHQWETRFQLSSIVSSIVCRSVRLFNRAEKQRTFRPLRKPSETEAQNKATKNRSILNQNQIFYGSSRDEYFTSILPFQAQLLKLTRSSAKNSTNIAITQIGFIDRYSRKCLDPNSLVTEKNSIVGHVTDQNQLNESQFNFSIFHSTTTQCNQYEYDDDVNIELVDD